MYTQSDDPTTRRPYVKRRRAEQEQETRRRITEAAVDLHGSVGPASTTISAIADRAGVRRATVYSHFPDERALFTACSSHWGERHPPPDLERWRAVEEARERTEGVLGELYGYFEANRRMLGHVIRDAETIEALRDAVAGGLVPYLDGVAGLLLDAWPRAPREGEALPALLTLATRFATWRHLAERGLSSGEAARVVADLAAAAAALRSASV